MNEIERTVCEAIDTAFDELCALSRTIHDHPECAFQEHAACATLTGFFAAHGFQVQTPVAGLDTAFTAELQGSAEGPCVALTAEYDALPIGHACGHNLIAAISAGAALGVRAVMDRLPGRLRVIGTPAEEYGGGKVLMCDRGVFDNVDFSMQVHPSAQTMVMRGGLAVRIWDIEFFGKMAHSSAPENGINALTACRRLFDGIDALRPTLPEMTNIHGVILDGGKAGNIIPDYAHAQFSVRAKDVASLSRAEAAMNSAIQSANALTGTASKLTRSVLYAERYPNRPMAEVFKAHMQAQGEPVSEPAPGQKLASSDVGNVSLMVPMIQPYLRISDADNHTPEFERDAVSDFAHEQMRKAARALALTACELLSSPELQRSARETFEREVPQYSREELGYAPRSVDSV